MITCFELETNVLNLLQQTLSSVSPREPVPATVADAVADGSSWAEEGLGACVALWQSQTAWRCESGMFGCLSFSQYKSCRTITQTARW